MSEKLSRGESKEVQSTQKAVLEVLNLAMKRHQSDASRMYTGDKVADDMIEQYTADMERVAKEHGLDVESIINSPEFAGEGLGSGKEVKEVAKAQAMRKIGQAELDKLAEERTKHEIEVLLGSPEARKKLYEFKERAQNIISKYGLNPIHLERFEIPNIPVEVKQPEQNEYTEAMPKKLPQKHAGAGEPDEPKDEAPLLERKKTWWGGRESDKSYAKRLAKEKESQEYAEKSRQADKNKYAEWQKTIAEQPEQAQRLGLTDLANELKKKIDSESGTHGGEKTSEQKKQALLENIKATARKYFKIGLFALSTAVATFSPYETSDPTIKKNTLGEKIEALAKTQETAKETRHKTHTPVRHETRILPHEQIAPLNLAELKQVRDTARAEMQAPRDMTAPELTLKNEDTSDTSKVMEMKQTRTKDTIAKIETADYARGPQTPDGLKPAPTKAPEVVSTYSPGAEPKTAETPVAGTHHGIEVQNFNADGTPLVVNQSQETPAVVNTPMPASPSMEPHHASHSVYWKSTISIDGLDQLPPRNPILDVETHAPATVATMESSSDMPLEEVLQNQYLERGHHLPVYAGNIYRPTDSTATMQKGWHGNYEIHEYQFAKVGKILIPHFLNARMDSVITRTLKKTPGALEQYIKISEKEALHDPYIIHVWNGTTGTEILVGPDNLLSAPVSHITAEQEPTPGATVITIENTPGTNDITFTGRGADYFTSLDKVDKGIIALTSTQTGKNEFTVYTIDGEVRADGTVQAFDSLGRVVYETPTQIEAGLQKELDALVKKRPLKMHPTEMRTYGEDGSLIIQKQWLPMYPKAPSPLPKEVRAKVKRILSSVSGKTKTKSTKKKRFIYTYPTN